MEKFTDNFVNDDFYYHGHHTSDYINILGLFDIPKGKEIDHKAGSERSLRNQEFITTSQSQSTSTLHPVTESQTKLM